ncbi:MAG: glycoside hydrolase family 5 protein [Acidimicrobiales bacterium]
MAAVLVVALVISGALLVATSGSTNHPGSSSTTSSPAVTSIRVSGNHLVNNDGQELRLIGVDATGTQNSCIKGTGFSMYPLGETAAKAIARWHADAVRVPLNEDCWLGINGVPAAYSGSAYQTQIVQWVRALNANGMYAILDLHFSAPGALPANQQWPMADADHSLSFWHSVASTFKNNHAVIFDVFNEPFMGGRKPTPHNWRCWLDGCIYRNPCKGAKQHCTPTSYQTAGEQQLVDAVRSTGATQPIMIGSLGWSNDPCGLFEKGGNGGQCPLLQLEPQDPDHQLVLSFHTYYTSACNTTSCYDKELLPILPRMPVVISEFGERDCSTTFDNNVMTWADQHKASYLAWAWTVNPVHSSTCIGSSIKTVPKTVMNQDLLSNFNGTPNTVAPEPLDIKNHLAQTSFLLNGTAPKRALAAAAASTPWYRRTRLDIGVALLVLAGIVLLVGLTSDGRRNRPRRYARYSAR